MSQNYDNWERLVRAVMRDEELRRIALWSSMESITISSASSSFRASSAYDSPMVNGSSQSFHEFPAVNSVDEGMVARSESLRFFEARALQIASVEDSQSWKWTTETDSSSKDKRLTFIQEPALWGSTEMGDVAIEFLLENLRQLLVYKASLISDVKNDVEGLYNDLGLLKAFLKDSTEKCSKHAVLKELVKQIRGVVYKAEDETDTYVAHMAPYPIKRAVHSLEYQENLRKVTEEIKVIRRKVSDIYRNKQFGLGMLQTRDGFEGSSKEKKAPIVEEDNVVGFDDEAKTVIGLLTGGLDELEVISIVGTAGLGKTTLAKMIYLDPAIEYEFDNRAWVYVSQDYSRKEVFLNILGYLTQVTEDMHKMNDENLAEELCEILEKGRYLVVMDDVWTEQAWHDLKIGFPENNRKSRILITSRIRKVAQHANPNSDPYDLRFLTPGESWKLLQLKALGSEDCPEEFIKDGIRIATQCQGLPLAIVLVGGILLEKGTDWWAMVARSVDAYMVMDQCTRVDILMELSYNHLPYHLKACFIYFGMFPVNFEIPVWELIRLWIAEGFIQSRDGMSLEDIGEKYLDNLVNRNLVMAGAWGSDGKLKTCRVHDMLHEFCKWVAKEENFFQEINWFDQGTYVSSNPTLHTYRRVCIHTRVFDYILSKPYCLWVRSFVCFSNEGIDLPAEHISSITGAFKLLRVLHARSITFERLPLNLIQLVHLRFIVISCKSRILPTAMSCLWNIQTFVVQTSSYTFDIRADLWKMIQLRHVKINACTTLPGPLSNGRKGKDEVLMLGSLQTLSTISPESCTEDVFSRTPNLKNLGIRGELAKLLESKDGNIPFDSLGKLDHLENLKLLNDVFPFPPFEGKLDCLPQTYKFPPKLKKLTLSDTRLDWKDMSTLGMLENLEILKLKNHAFEGYWWQSYDGGFRSLKVLHIGRTNLVTWHAEAHHFPRLRQLCLRHCSNLLALPLAFADISSLQQVEMYYTNKNAAFTARKVQEKILEKQNQMQGGRSTGGGGFKLSIYPPDQE